MNVRISAILLVVSIQCGSPEEEYKARKSILARVSQRWMAPGERKEKRSRTATIVAGHLRTGKFEQVQENIRESIFAALGGTDVYWVISDAAESVEYDILTTLNGWDGLRMKKKQICSVWLAFVDHDVFDRTEDNCAKKIDQNVPGLGLRACMPARPQFLAMAMAWTALLDAEKERHLKYEWVLRLRTDMVYKKKLPHYKSWQSAPKAIYLDGWRFFQNCSRSTPCTCFCVGDRFGIVHRSLAHHVFATALDLLRYEGCKQRKQCPGLYRKIEDKDTFKQQLNKTNCFLQAKSHLYPECILGSMLILAGLDPYTQIKRLYSGDLISCGSHQNSSSHSPLQRKADDHVDFSLRIGDGTAPCQVPYWRPVGYKDRLAQSILDKPIPLPKATPTLFWLDHSSHNDNSKKKTTPPIGI